MKKFWLLFLLPSCVWAANATWSVYSLSLVTITKVASTYPDSMLFQMTWPDGTSERWNSGDSIPVNSAFVWRRGVVTVSGQYQDGSGAWHDCFYAFNSSPSGFLYADGSVTLQTPASLGITYRVTENRCPLALALGFLLVTLWCLGREKTVDLLKRGLDQAKSYFIKPT